MCTAVAFEGKHRYFGRNLDLEGGFGESVVITPRNLKINFRREGAMERHFAMIGMAIVQGGMPLYFDAINEHGLGMAGLNFPKSAVYNADMVGVYNVAPFEIIPFVLGKCKTLGEARSLLERTNLVNISFSEQLPLTPLHWMVSDGRESLVVEPTAEGLKLYENKAGVMTNEPPFPMQLNRLADYMSLTPNEPKAAFGAATATNYSRGMGSIGLPGDFASAGRFVRAAFVREFLLTGDKAEEDVNGFFHILKSVAVPRGCMCLRAGVYEETIYSCCCDLDEGIYFYTTYENPAIHAVKLHAMDLEATMPATYPLQTLLEVKLDN